LRSTRHPQRCGGSWHPGVTKTTGESGNEPDVAKRRLTLGNGATIDESLYKYDAREMSYSYRIDTVERKMRGS
jgi:hypothetical protein